MEAAVAHAPAAIALLLYCGAVLFSVSMLSVFHCGLVCSGKSTYESVRLFYVPQECDFSQVKGIEPPARSSNCQNMTDALCAPLPAYLKTRDRTAHSEPNGGDACVIAFDNGENVATSVTGESEAHPLITR